MAVRFAFNIHEHTNETIPEYTHTHTHYNILYTQTESDGSACVLYIWSLEVVFDI